MKIAIMGAGMVGGALARYFSQHKGIKPILYDPPKGLGDKEELNKANIVFICVPTPYREEIGFDTVYLDEAFAALINPKTIIIKSTVEPGTTDVYQAKYPQHKILFNPEFLTEATADYDTLHPNRQIIGYTDKSRSVAEEILNLLPVAPFQKIMKAKEAEMVKYFSNTFYALKVAFANQFYDLCQKIGVDYETIKECTKAEPMMGINHWDIFHKGYRGYGGKCLPKDTRTIIRLAKKCGMDFGLLLLAEEYNDELVKKQQVNDKSV